MKKWIVVALVVALALSAASLAVAKSGKPGVVARGKLKYNLVGKVAAVDAGAAILTAHVTSGTKTVKAWRHKNLVLVVDAKAVLRLMTKRGLVKVTLANIPQYAQVKVRGFIDRTDPSAIVYHATFVQARAVPAHTPTPSPSPSVTP